MEALSPLIKSMEQEISSFNLDENLEVGHMVEPVLIPKLNRLLEEVCQTLEVHEPFEFFVTNQPIQGAWMWAVVQVHTVRILLLSPQRWQ